MAIKGDFGKLKSIAKKVRNLGEEKHLRALARNLGEETLELVNQGFASSQSPEGARWASLVLRSGQPLRDTGRLQRSFNLKNVTSSGFTVATGVAYAGYHQSGVGPIRPKKAKLLAIRVRGSSPIFSRGTSGIPARPMLPTSGALPARWSNVLVQTAEEFFQSLIGA